jgi:Ni,Fe-hydrogenase III large subunit
MWLCEQISGNRKTYGMNLVGGVRRDIPESLHPTILETLDKIESQSRTMVEAIIKDTPLLMRLKGVGVLSGRMPASYALLALQPGRQVWKPIFV